MEIKREVQGTIVPPAQNPAKASEEEFLTVLKAVSPGTNLRAAMDGALKAGKGALIAVENQDLNQLIDGGFKLNCKFTAQKMIELCKMDGAIILSQDMKKINYANVLLTPDSKIKSSETGTRHKAAERTARQSATMVIAISERKHEISLFYKNIKYLLRNTDELLRKVNAHIQILEKHREIFDKQVDKLNTHEVRNYPNLLQAVEVIQKGRMIQKIAQDLRRYIIELGNEATIFKTRLKELTLNIEKETNLVIKDYTKLDLKKSKILIDSLSYDEILDQENILRSLAYEKPFTLSNIKGWRILSKTSLNESEIAAVTKEMGSLGKALHSNGHTFHPILGEEKAKIFKEEIDKIKLNI